MGSEKPNHMFDLYAAFVERHLLGVPEIILALQRGPRMAHKDV